MTTIICPRDSSLYIRTFNKRFLKEKNPWLTDYSNPVCISYILIDIFAYALHALNVTTFTELTALLHWNTGSHMIT